MRAGPLSGSAAFYLDRESRSGESGIDVTDDLGGRGCLTIAVAQSP